MSKSYKASQYGSKRLKRQSIAMNKQRQQAYNVKRVCLISTQTSEL